MGSRLAVWSMLMRPGPVAMRTVFTSSPMRLMRSPIRFCSKKA